MYAQASAAAQRIAIGLGGDPHQFRRRWRGYSSINTILGRQRSGEERLQETPEALIDDGISLADETAVERFDKLGRYFIRRISKSGTITLPI
jgi:hypothetical protein